MSDLKIPTVGRIVHYFPNGKDNHCAANGAVKVPAIVVQSWGDGNTRLNLSVFPMNQDSPNVLRYSVNHKSSLSLVLNEECTAAYWDWPEREAQEPKL